MLYLILSHCRRVYFDSIEDDSITHLYTWVTIDYATSQKREKGERKMKTMLALVMISLFVISMLPACVPKARAELISSSIKPVSAWIFTSSQSVLDNGLSKFKENIDLFEAVYPFAYEFDGTPTLAEMYPYQESSKLQESVEDVKVIPTLRDDYPNIPNAIHPGSYLAQSTFRDAYVAAILSKVESMNYYGVDIDFETLSSADSPAFSSFMQTLSAGLHDKGKILTMAVSGDWIWTDRLDFSLLGAVCDKVEIMMYNGEPPSTDLVKVYLDKAISIIPKERIVFATRFNPDGYMPASLLAEQLDVVLAKGIRNEICIWGLWDVWNDSPSLWNVIREKLAMNRGWVEEGVTRNVVPKGCALLDLEEGTEASVIKSTVQGLRFTTTQGYDWLYCDIRTGGYNARSLTDPNVNFGVYVVNGYFAAWLGIYAGQGRIDFVLGPASYFSVLTSTYSGLCLEAYDSNGNMIATSGWAQGNLYTYTFTRLTVAAEGIAYVIVHDTGNYWEIDDIVTDAPSWGSRISSENIKKIPQRFELNLIEGSWTIPNSMIEIDIYDITMRVAGLLTELTPQAADNLVANFAVVLKDRNNDGKVSPDEILQNILEQIPEEIAKEYFKFIVEQIYSMNLEPPSPDYGQNLLTQISNFGATVASAVETYGPTVLAIIAIPVAISTGFTTYGIGGYQAITGIYVPTNALLGTTGDITTTMYSHGDLVIVDSEGQVLCKEFSQIPGGTYIEVDLNRDGSPDDVAVLPATTRNYIINIVPDADASSEETFTLTMANLGIYFDLVKDLHFSNIPEHGYGLQASMPPTDSIPPTTTLTIGNPQYTDDSGKKYITSATPLTLTAEDNVGGTGVASTHYRIYNTTSYDTGLITSMPPIEFHLTGIDDGEYSIDFYSVDNVGNVESTITQKVILDNTAPSLAIETPSQCAALEDGVNFTISATDLSAVSSVMVSIRSAQGNVLSSQFELMPATLKQDKKWHLYFDTRQLPDGFYSFIANGTDVLGNSGTRTVKFSIRNWAAIQLLPSTPSSKAGRTMPIKFSIRVKASVDPAQPFIYNEELTIKVYKIASPSNLLLQTSTFGSGSTNYRIDTGTLYITNFKTQSTPATYLINIYRKGVLIGSFQFSTVK